MGNRTIGLISGFLITLVMLTASCSAQTTALSSPGQTPAVSSNSGSAPTPTTTSMEGAQTASDANKTQETGTPAGAPPFGTPPSGTPPNGTPPGGAPPSGEQGGGPGAGAPPGNSGSSAAVTGTAVYSQSGGEVSKSNQSITASEQNQSAVIITNSGTYNLTDSSISTTGDTTSMDSSSFYGLNAAVLAESGSQITLSKVIVKTTGSGGNGVFATGTGSTVNLSDVTINCTNTGAHGVDATNGGTLNLTNVDITTAGNGASAAIATDRGSGTINVTGGTVTTSGTKSPAIYSTGKITVSGAVMKATGSEAVAIEGKNTVTLKDTTLSGVANWGVIIYQSMSGDSEVGTGNFIMNGGSLIAESGPLFYTTNTQAVINLKGTDLVNPSGVLLKAAAGDWGASGSNGATVTFTADSENLNGSIICDKISSVSFILKNGTAYQGALNAEHTAKSMVLNLDDSSVWEVTDNSYLSALTDTDTALSNIHSNGHTVYYDASNNANSWLNGQTYDLTDGGQLTPAS